MSCTIVKKFYATQKEDGIRITAQLGDSNCFEMSGDIAYDLRDFDFETVEKAREFFAPYFEQEGFARGFYSAYVWAKERHPEIKGLTFLDKLPAPEMFENAIASFA